MTIKVINSQIYGNPYQKLLYTSIESRYQIASGSLNDAITQQRLCKRSLYHIHWEESLFARCSTTARATRVRREYVEKLKQYIALGGKVVWTLHNVKPHEWRFVQTLISLRKELAMLSHCILLHNQTALSTLQAQTGIPSLPRARILPHPTYFDVYEPADRTISLAGRVPIHSRTLLHFGLIRAYKGIPELIQKLPEEFMTANQLALHVYGKPVRADSFLNDLLTQTQNRPDIKYSLDSAPVEEVAELLRSHAGLLVPYHKVLTSGVAILGLTFGVPVIAPDTSAMRELFPQSSYALLFNPRSAKDLRRAILTLANMSAETRMQISQDYIKQALAIRPELISKELGDIYDELLGLTPPYENQLAAELLPIDSELENTSALLHRRQWKQRLDTALRHRVPVLLQLISENIGKKNYSAKPENSEFSNQKLALELVKATLVSNTTYSTTAANLISNNMNRDINKLMAEQANLDAAYAARLYRDTLDRLEATKSDLT